MSDDSGGLIEVLSGVSAFTGKPFVTLRWGNESGQFTPDEARTHARKIMEAAEASVMDAAVSTWTQEKLGMKPTEAAQILNDLRQYRLKYEGDDD